MPSERVFTDQLHRQVRITVPPKRIISLVPSQTELLFDLGLNDEIAGVTKFCIHPASLLKSKTKVGGTKQIDLNLIRQLNPDLIIGNKEENHREQIEQLMDVYPVWLSDIYTLQDALDMIGLIGEVTGKTAYATDLRHTIDHAFAALKPTEPKLKVAYFIWRKPYMVAGKNTFIDDMLQRCGFENAFNRERYPQVSADEIKNAQPHLILLSSEPYPFKTKHLHEFGAIVPLAKIELVDGELFSWYGSRLRFAPAYFKKLIAGFNVR